MDLKSISVIGLGHLGAPLAACVAKKGYKVIGVDVIPEVIEKINNGIAPVYEPNLQELLNSVHTNLRATGDFEDAIINSFITFIIVPTPSEESGKFSCKYVIEASKEIGLALQKKDKFHLVVLVSTVLPGSTEEEVCPVLEEYSHKKCGKDFGLCYNPEFIALGSVIKNMLNPDFVLIGESDSYSGDILEDFYKGFCENSAPIARMSIINAELTKIALNAYVTTKISFANMLARICERLPGGNVDVVTNALGLDTRIGAKYLKGAIGYGGPCFPRDNIAFSYMARKLGIKAPISEITHKFNCQQVDYLLELVLSKLPPQGKVGILGMAYKPDTNVIEESQSVKLACELIRRKIPVLLYDAHALENTKKIVGEGAIFTKSIEECVRESNVVVVAQPMDEFKDISPVFFSHHSEKPVVIDCWRILDKKKYEKKVQYIALGLYD